MSVFDRTFHPDEANQAFTVGRLLETGRYVYNPSDHHGPTLYYAAAPIQRLAGATGTASLEELPLRATPLVFAVLTVALAFFAAAKTARRGWAGIARAAAAVLPLATLPALFFYGTFFIQETLLGCFLAGMLACAVAAWRAAETPGRIRPGFWASVGGVFAGLAFATKETSVISFAAAALAALPFLPRVARCKFASRFAKSSFIIPPFAVALAVAVIFFSSFGTDFSGVKAAFIDAPLAYLGRANGSAASAGAAYHVHEWWWYFGKIFAARTFNSIPLAAFAVAAFALRRRRVPPLAAYLALNAAILLAIYSLIPYKTPWCMLTVLETLALAAGFATLPSRNIEAPAPRRASLAVGAALAIALAFVVRDQFKQCRKIAVYPDSPAIPFNYANASWDVKQAAGKVCAAVDRDGDGAWAAVCVPPDELWPLPWYLRKTRAGFWPSIDALPADAEPSAIVVPADTASDRARERYPRLDTGGMYGIRPGVLCNVLWKEPADAPEHQ